MQDGQARRHDDHRHLEWPGAQDEQRDERHGRARHDGPELRDGLAGPQLHEVGVTPE